VMRENADEELRSRLKEADANLLLVEEAQKRIAALEEETRSREREVQSLQERLKEGENTVKDLEASATSRHATEVRIHFPLVCASHRRGVAWLRYNDGSGKGRFRAWQERLKCAYSHVYLCVCVCVCVCVCDAQEGRRALMMKKEELERSLASSEEEAAAVRRALAAAERRGNDLSRKLREAEEREAAMHSEQVR
jgi:septal ring factor EnvC (AmiA/AmiB activator)